MLLLVNYLLIPELQEIDYLHVIAPHKVNHNRQSNAEPTSYQKTQLR